MRRDRFGRGGAFRCRVCGKTTRDTGHLEANFEMCRYCIELAELDNSLSDGYITQEEYDLEAARIEKERNK